MDTAFVPLIIAGSFIGLVVIFGLCDRYVGCWRNFWKQEEPDLESQY